MIGLRRSRLFELQGRLFRLDGRLFEQPNNEGFLPRRNNTEFLQSWNQWPAVIGCDRLWSTRPKRDQETGFWTPTERFEPLAILR